MNPKFFQTQNSFWSQKIFSKIFSDTIYFWPKLFLTNNFWWPTIFSELRFYRAQNLFQKIFLDSTFFSKNIFGLNIFLGLKFILATKLFWNHIFFLPKIFLDPNFFVDPKCFIPFFERFSHFPHAPAKDVCWIYSRINISCNLCIHLMFNKIPSQKNSFLAFCTWCLLRIEYNPLAALSSKNSKKFVEFLCVGAKIYSFLVFRKITFRIHLNFSPLACIIFQSLFDEITFHGNDFVC